MWRKTQLIVTIIEVLFLAACQAQTALTSTMTATAMPAVSATYTTIPPAQTGTPQFNSTESPTLFPLPMPDASIVTCNERYPADVDLLPIVTASFGLAHDYVPSDLVRLGNYLPANVTFPDMTLRREAAEALRNIIRDMRDDELAPTVLSSYRSYF